MIKIGVIGSSSMIGSRYCDLAKEAYLIKADLNGKISVDITDHKSVGTFFSSFDFEWAILFSAYTDVDGAENQRGKKNDIAWKINVDGVKNTVDAASKYSKKLIFISTSFVFDGTEGPYSENDRIGENLDLVSWYGITKIEAEKQVAKLQESLILRITYPYRANFPKKEDFARKILSSYKKGTLYPMFYDQQLTPTFVDDLEPAIRLLISKNLTGIYHLASPEMTNPYVFAKKLLTTFEGKDVYVKKGSLKDFLSKKDSTPRPLYGGLKVDKLIKTGFKPTSWKQGIKKLYEQSRNN